MLRGRHALVTDFGVAKAVSEATGRHELTTAGVALGTPAYMAPEQAAADPQIDHRADIYAVGALAYELLTGRPPFTGTTQQEILAAHITQPPEPLTKHRESLPPGLERLVMRCLEKKPADRWQTAEEILPQLETLATPSGGLTPTATMPVRAVSRSRKMAIAASAVAVMFAVIVLAVFLSRGSDVELAAQRVVVAPFTNLTGEDSLDVRGLVAASWITNGLQQIDDLSVVPWSSVQDEVIGLGRENTSQDLAEITGAGIVVTGTFSRLGDSLRFQVEITNPNSMEVLATVPPVNGLVMNPESVFVTLEERIAVALAVLLDAETGSVASLSLHQPTFAAYKESVTGMDRFSRYRMEEAIEHLTRSHALDTTFVSVLLWAAVGHLNIGHEAQADSLVEIVSQYRDLLSSFDRQLLGWFVARQQDDLQETWRISRELGQQSTKLRYQFANEAIGINRPTEAVETLESIDPTRGFMKQWVPYWQVLTMASHLLGDHGNELRDARRGRERHPNNRSALLNEVRALAALGRNDEVRMLLDELPGLPPRASWGHAFEAAVAGLEFRAHGFADVADEFLQLAMDRLRTHSPGEGWRENHQYNIGQVLYLLEQLEEARDVFLSLATQSPGDEDYVGYLGVVGARMGNDVEAWRISEELAAMDRPYLRGSHTSWRARIAAVLVDREQAVELLHQSFSEGYPYGIDLHRDIDLESLHDYPPFQEFMRPKG
jgi:tetratricopeptide (TPR) repeat protein/TolB-like protein